MSKTVQIAIVVAILSITVVILTKLFWLAIIILGVYGVWCWLLKSDTYQKYSK